jgi:DNA-binding transcriptional LysR family regulator
MDIPLTPLGTFHQVVLHEGFNKAARVLGITQPAVTQRVRRLEQAVGLPLFHRNGRRVVLTEAGQTLEAFAARIFHLVDAAADALQGAAALETGHLKIGASRTAGAYYVSELLDRFKRAHPGVRVSLSVGNSQVILAGIVDFTLHAGLIAGRPDDPQLRSRPLIRDRMLVVLPPDHRLARKAVVEIRDLRGCPLILREPGSTTRRVIERAFQAQGLGIDPAMELESNEAIKSAVADGLGVAIMAQAAVAQDLAAGRLVARRLREALTLDFALVYHADRVLSPVLSAFLAALPGRRGGGRSFPRRREPKRSA